MNIHNKTFLITGASSGFGWACAKMLASLGGQLILVARRGDRLSELAESLREQGCNVYIQVLDVSDAPAVDTFVQNLPKEFQTIDGLINNAGCAVGVDTLANLQLDDMNQMIDVNIKGLLYFTRAVLPIMLKRKSGHIINIGSTAAYNVYPTGGVYCATKHAVRAITKTLRLETANTGIRVTEIDPGMVETEFSLVRFKGDEKSAKSVYSNIANPITADDIADAIVYAITRPHRVNIAQIMLYATDQIDRLPT